MKREQIETQGAPAAVGTYSQAIRCGATVYLSGQLPIAPSTQRVVDAEAGIERQMRQVFDNLRAVARAADGDLAQVVKLNVYLLDMADAPRLNAVMAGYFAAPYPARAAVGVASLPAGCRIEAEAVMVLG